MVVDGSGGVPVRSDYHAFGQRWQSAGIQALTSKDRWLYNGKESQESVGLNYLDYGANSNYARSFVWGNPSELASLFLFASDHSSVEWRFSRFDIGNGDQYALGTIHNSDLAINPEQMGFDRLQEIALIHSHPSKRTQVTGGDGEYGGMGWQQRQITDTEADFWGYRRGSILTDISGDSKNVYRYHMGENSYKSYNHSYVYYPYSGNLFHIRGAQYPAFIKNIKGHNNNPKRLFWGILNGK